jgi:crotonobetainyl-CoA:carnitine CoA-transferase CaiB-like acyl-CoA transferase
MQQLLSDLSVAEIGEGVSASFAGKMLADLGADVFKVERPAGDPLRWDTRAPGSPDGTRRSGAFLQLNANKRSVVLDPANPIDCSRLWELLDDVDLVFETLPAGNLGDYRVTWEALHERCPELSVVQISGFGATGPYANLRSSDLVDQAISMSLYPLQSGPPVKMPGHMCQVIVGHLGALAGLGAVRSVDLGGEGAWLECAAIEALATQPRTASYLLAHQYTGAKTVLRRPSESLIPSGVHPCGDGYVAMLSTPQQLSEMIEVLDDETLRAAFAEPDAFSKPETKEILDAVLYPWLVSHSRAELTETAQAAGWPLAGVNRPEELLDADHLRSRGFWQRSDDPVVGSVDLAGPPARHEVGGYQLRTAAPLLDEHRSDLPDGSAEHRNLSPRSPSANPRPPAQPPLAGVRVLDLTTVWAGPYATQLLADLGAEVIRIENPFVLPPSTKGYTARPPADLSSLGFLGSMYGPAAEGRGDRPWNRHAMNNAVCSNKLSMTVDTRREEGREIVMRLAEVSDVFIENFKRTGLENIGYSVEELRRRNPRLIVTRMPPAGLTGGWSGYTGFGAQFDGLSGLASLMGHPRSDPTTTPATMHMDSASGPAAAFATVAALRARERSGKGMVIDVSQVENVIQQMGDLLVEMQLGTPPQRIGNRDPLVAPQGVYPCAGEEQWIAISVTDDEAFAALARLLGRPELAADDRFSNAGKRYDNHDELDAVLVDWTSDRDKHELFHELQASGVAAGPVLHEDEFSNDPHIIDRAWMTQLQSDDVGVHAHPGLAWRGGPVIRQHGSPTLGQHNEYVYKGILGVSDTEYERLRRTNHVAIDYLDAEGRPH